METKKALGRSHAYLFFARGLTHPGETPWLPELGESAEAVAPWLAAGGLEVEGARLAALRASFVAGEGRGTLREECVRLFGNLRAGGSSPYETEFSHAHVFQRAQQMADIAGFYRAFGLEASGEGERVDHIAAELEFMHFLTWKEAYAAEHDPSQVEVCRDAERKFLADHLGRWTGIFAQIVAQTTRDEFYIELTRLLDEFVAADAAALGARPERVMTVPPQRREDEDARNACGGISDLVEISKPGGTS